MTYEVFFVGNKTLMERRDKLLGNDLTCIWIDLRIPFNKFKIDTRYRR